MTSDKGRWYYQEIISDKNGEIDDRSRREGTVFVVRLGSLKSRPILSCRGRECRDE